jgi:hypothetical protein
MSEVEFVPMLSKEIIELFINNRMNSGVFKFGWHDDIKEYKLIGYRDYHMNQHGIIGIDCEYVDRGQLYVKCFQVRYTELQEFMRDEKLKQLL